MNDGIAGGTFTLPLKSVIALTGGKIGLDEYPLFNPEYRDTLNKKIIDHFYNREIGMETIDLFQLAMRRKMNEIMPLYNNMYRATLDGIDPFVTHRMTTTTASQSESSNTSSSESSSTNNSDSTSKSRAVSSNTPQTRLAGDEDYATAAQDSASESNAAGTASDTSSGSGQGATTGTATDHSEGFSGRSLSSLLLEYRQAFVNVDLEIINDLESLFMSVWDNGDEFSPVRYPVPYYYGYGWF